MITLTSVLSNNKYLDIGLILGRILRYWVLVNMHNLGLTYSRYKQLIMSSSVDALTFKYTTWCFS